MTKPVILTGLRANNDLHLGNFLGALLPMIELANSHAGEYQINLFVPDLHSFTTPIDHNLLYEQTMHNLRLYAAAGLNVDHPDIFIYRQSYIPAHSELAWILGCFTGFGEMSRMTQFKEKGGERLTKENAIAISNRLTDEFKELGLSEQEFRKVFAAAKNTIYEFSRENKQVSVGLYSYPVLMAADILLYDALYIPVGDDQTQHIEFTRDIAERINNRFSKTIFTIPHEVKKQNEFFGHDQGLRIRDLVDPAKKMSKSDESGKGVLFLGDNPESAAKKIMGAATDSFSTIRFDMERQSGISNLLRILALLSKTPLKDVISKYEGQTKYGPLKEDVAQIVTDFLSGFQQKANDIDDKKLLTVLNASESAMNISANKKLISVQQAVGLRSAFS